MYKDPYSWSYGFFSSHVWIWKLDHKEGWTPRNWCFWTVVLEKTLPSPLDCKEIKPVDPKGNQSSILLEGLTLKLKCQYFGHLMQRANSWEETLMLGKIEGRRRRGQQMRRLDGTQWTWVWASSRRWWRTGKPGVLQPMGSQSVGHDWATEHITQKGWKLRGFRESLKGVFKTMSEYKGRTEES